jgi:DTW domain-containing protein YfiP
VTRRLRSDRCADCGLPPALCLCAALHPVVLPFGIVIVQHAKEAPRPSNSAGLLRRLVPETRFVRHGAVDGPETAPDFAAPGLVLFPDDEAPVLSPRDRPATLVVPDGNWRQCRRMVRRVPWVADLPRRRLPPGPPPLARLRGHPEADHHATLEAVARAVGLLAGPGPEATLATAWVAFAAQVERWRVGGV